MNKKISWDVLVVGVIFLLFFSALAPISFGSYIIEKNRSITNTIIYEGSLLGYVNDSFGNPIEGALVRVYFHETYEDNYSDSNGYYYVDNIPLCNCLKNASCSKDGYKTECILLSIHERTTHDFVLIYNGNHPPDAPIVTGPYFTKPVIPYECKIMAIDPDGDNVSYQVDWDDGIISEWTGWHLSGEEIIQSHIYSEQANYRIKSRAKDTNDAIGEWGYIIHPKKYLFKTIESKKDCNSGKIDIKNENAVHNLISLDGINKNTYQKNYNFNNIGLPFVFFHDNSFFKKKPDTSLDVFIKNDTERTKYQMLINIGISVHNTNDKGYIVCGYTSNNGCYGGFLIKTDSLGYEIWNKTYFIKLDTIFYSVEQTSDGGYIVTGTTYDGWNDTDNVFLLKTDGQGNKIWDQTYDDLGNVIGMEVKLTDDGGFIVSGLLENNDSDSSCILLIKTDIYGALIWFNTFEFEYDVVWVKIQQSNDNGFIIGGTIRNLWYNSYVFLLKTDENGNEIWNKTYIVMNYTYCYSFIQSNDGGFVLVGYTQQSLFQYMLIIKTNDIGVEEWVKTYEDSYGFSVKQTYDNGFIIGGAVLIEDEVYALLFKTDLYGNEMWNKTYNGLEEAQCLDVIETEDKGYVLTGMTSSSLNSNITYTLLLKTDNNGNEQWFRYFNINNITPGFVKFYGWDIDNSCYKVNVKIDNYGMSKQSTVPIGYYETSYIGLCPGSYRYFVSWFGKEASCNIVGYVNVNAGEYKEILQNLSFCDNLPNIKIIKPEKAIYISNKRIISFFISIIIGNIDVEVNAYDYSSGIDYVEFYIDNKKIYNDSSEPYSLQWNKWAFGKHIIKTIAVDEVGYQGSDEIIVWKYF